MRIPTFNVGGIKLPDYKEFTKDLPIEEMKEPEYVTIPLIQNPGVPAKPIVKEGDRVKIGQKIGEAQGNFSLPVHSSIAGEVIAIKEFPHPTLKYSTAIRIKNDFSSEWFNCEVESIDSDLFKREETINQIQDAGIAGLGGACFPTHIKLNPPESAKIDFLIINGAECEPFLSCDHRLMLEESELILEGIKIISSLINPEIIYIGVEINKLDVIEKIKQIILESNSELNIKVVPLKEKYPQGAEKNLIQAVCNRIVPIGKLPFDAGVIVNNVQTVIAVAQAIKLKKPLIERVLTVSGDCINNHKNLRVKIGTSLNDIIEFCGGFKVEPEKIIFGGPMTGFSQNDLESPVIKSTSGIIAFSKSNIIEESQCIRCSRCIKNCPMGLMPLKIMEYSKANEIDLCEKYFAVSCVECGLCSYGCPANIQIMNYIKDAKVQILRKGK